MNQITRNSNIERRFLFVSGLIVDVKTIRYYNGNTYHDPNFDSSVKQSRNSQRHVVLKFILYTSNTENL